MSHEPDFQSIEDPALRVSLEVMWEQAQGQAQRRRTVPSMRPDGTVERVPRKPRPPDDEPDDEINLEAHIDVLAWKVEERFEAGQPVDADTFDEIFRDYYEAAELSDEGATYLAGVAFERVVLRLVERKGERRDRQIRPPDEGEREIQPPDQ